MKETPISNCEKNFILQALKQQQRLDGRKLGEFRKLKINFGSDWGSAHVSMGKTKILAQVSCDLGQPQTTRPTEGMIFINMEIGQMAAVHFETGRNSNLLVKTTRILERTFKDSRCIDLESLCVQAEEKVWILRLDLNVLNFDGNITDCASIAALAALAHFKRPDVSIDENEVKIHSAAEKDFIPIVLHHYPVCISYAIYEKGTIALADPTYIEERASDATMVFGLNSYRELCCLNFGGTTLSDPSLLLKQASRAATKAKEIVDYVKTILSEDLEERIAGKSVGFTACLKLNKLSSLAEDRLSLRLRDFSFDAPFKPIVLVPEESDNVKAEKLDSGITVLTSNQAKWLPETDSDDEDSDNGMQGDSETFETQFEQSMENPNKQLKANTKKNESKNKIETVSEDSEEEETKMLFE